MMYRILKLETAISLFIGLEVTVETWRPNSFASDYRPAETSTKQSLSNNAFMETPTKFRF